MYPEGKVDDLCGMKTRVCAAIVENWGDNDFRLPHRKKGLTLSLAFVRAFFMSPVVPSRGRYSASSHSATPDLDMKRRGSVVKKIIQPT